VKINSLSQKEAEILDKKLIYNIGIPRIVLMENAGRGVADFIIKNTKISECVIIISGPGYNGGDGLVAARHLHIAGRKVIAFLAGRKDRTKDETVLQIRILEGLGVKVKEIAEIKDTGKIAKRIGQTGFLIDAVLGVGLRGEVRPLAGGIIECINSSGLKIVSVDIPSGLDTDKGVPHGAAVKADYTLTFQAPKKGSLTYSGRKFSGKVKVVKIVG